MTTAFDASWRRAYVDQLRLLLPGRCNRDLDILPFEQTLAALGRAGEVDLGLQEVAVDAIVGTVARAGDFDRRLRPRSRHLRDRWETLAGTERELPPVRLLRLNDLYFVADGHHRVSIARARGMATVPAHVRRILTVACADRCLTVYDLPAKAELRAFLERVPLPDDVRVGLSLDDPSQWRRLADAAEAWGFRQTIAQRAVTDRCELALAWWTEEVLPVVDELRCRGIGLCDADIQAYASHLEDGPITRPS